MSDLEDSCCKCGAPTERGSDLCADCYAGVEWAEIYKYTHGGKTIQQAFEELRMDNETKYRNFRGINATAIKAGATSMRAMRWAMENESRPSRSMAVGTLVHEIVLLNRTIDASQQTEIDAVMCAESVIGNADALRLLKGAFGHEVELYWHNESCGDCKARLDAVAPDYFIDLKTSADVDARSVGNAIARYRYDLQIGWYALACERKAAFLIFAQNRAPFDVSVWSIPETMLYRWAVEATKIAARYRECEKANNWPGVSPDVREVQLPAWFAEAQDVPSAMITADEL